jgi:hypothetical protein
MLLSSVFVLLVANVLAFPSPAGDSPEEYKEDDHEGRLSHSRSQFSANSFVAVNECKIGDAICAAEGPVTVLEPNGETQTCEVTKKGRKSCIVRISHKVQKIFGLKKNKTQSASIIGVRTEKMADHTCRNFFVEFGAVLTGLVLGPPICALAPAYTVVVQVADFTANVIQGKIPLYVAPMYIVLTKALQLVVLSSSPSSTLD